MVCLCYQPQHVLNSHSSQLRHEKPHLVLALAYQYLVLRASQLPAGFHLLITHHHAPALFLVHRLLFVKA